MVGHVYKAKKYRRLESSSAKLNRIKFLEMIFEIVIEVVF